MSGCDAEIIPLFAGLPVGEECWWCDECARAVPVDDLCDVDGLLMCRPCRLDLLGRIIGGRAR